MCKGNSIPVSGTANPLLDQDGSPIGALVMLRDMTEALRIQQLMVESERLGVAAEMAAGVAHTVNNVLLIISGNAEALTRHLPPERQRQVENIHAGVRRISDLTARLLTFTDAGAENAGSVDLNDVVQSSLAQEGPFPPEVRMHLALSPSPIMVRGAAEKLSVAVSSVLRNAREAIQGAGLIDISTWSEPGPEEGERIFLRIRDNGEGMTTEVQQRLFTPYVSTRFYGRGLGLATARATLAAHGGHLAIDSVPGKGTTVTIILPAATDERSRQEDLAFLP